MCDQKGAFEIIATNNDCGKRLDFFVAESIESGQRNRVAELVKQHIIVVNGCLKKPSYKIKPGDVVTGQIPSLPPLCFEPEKIDLDILYEDKDILAINKQAGLVVHPAPGNWTGTLVNGLLYHYPEIESCDDEIRPGIVHRLDKDTSGVMVIAKNRESLFKLSELFRSRDVIKQYVAIVHGSVENDHGVIDLPVGRHPVDRKKMSTKSPRSRHAITHYTVEKRYGYATRLLCDIKTGRTHQIRVHCQSMNHAIVGDGVYGPGNKKNKNAMLPVERMLFDVKRQMLHSHYLHFTHPITHDKMTLRAPIPKDMAEIIDRLEQFMLMPSL